MSNIIEMIFIQLLHLIPQAIIVIACIIYIFRTQSLAGVITLIGSLGNIAVLIGSIALTVIGNLGHFDSGHPLAFMRAIQIGYFISTLMFAGGFIGIALTARRKQPPQTDQGYITTER